MENKALDLQHADGKKSSEPSNTMVENKALDLQF
jgi:hypothetical protein